MWTQLTWTLRYCVSGAIWSDRRNHSVLVFVYFLHQRGKKNPLGRETVNLVIVRSDLRGPGCGPRVGGLCGPALAQSKKKKKKAGGKLFIMYSHFPPRLITDMLFLFPLSKSLPAFLHPLRFSPHSPQEVASLCPPSLLILPFFLLSHIWSGSCGWPGFSRVEEGVEGRRNEGGGERVFLWRGRGWVGGLSIAKPRAQKVRVKGESWKEKKQLKPNLFSFSQSIYHTVSLCTIKLTEKVGGGV